MSGFVGIVPDIKDKFNRTFSTKLLTVTVLYKQDASNKHGEKANYKNYIEDVVSKRISLICLKLDNKSMTDNSCHQLTMTCLITNCSPENMRRLNVIHTVHT